MSEFDPLARDGTNRGLFYLFHIRLSHVGLVHQNVLNSDLQKSYVSLGYLTQFGPKSDISTIRCVTDSPL